MKRETLCPADEIAEGNGRSFAFGREEQRIDIFVFRHKGEILAYRNSCPHVGVPLDWATGQFLDPEGVHFQCPLHGALFQIEDGLCILGPCQGESLETVEVVVENGVLYFDC